MQRAIPLFPALFACLLCISVLVQLAFVFAPQSLDAPSKLRRAQRIDVVPAPANLQLVPSSADLSAPTDPQPMPSFTNSQASPAPAASQLVPSSTNVLVSQAPTDSQASPAPTDSQASPALTDSQLVLSFPNVSVSLTPADSQASRAPTDLPAPTTDPQPANSQASPAPIDVLLVSTLSNVPPVRPLNDSELVPSSTRVLVSRTPTKALQVVAPPTNFNQTAFQRGHVSRFPHATRGIVVCLYEKIAAMGISLIQDLRLLNNSLPIQVYTCLRSELSAATRARILAADVLDAIEIVDVCRLLVKHTPYLRRIRNARAYQSYYIKNVALLHTHFDDVMLLDADDIFLRNPDVLWDTPPFQSTGTLFFYDRQIDYTQFFNTPLSSNETGLHSLFREFPYARFNLTRLEPSAQLRQSKAWQHATAHEQDSSVVLVRKSRVGHTMLQVLWHLVHELRREPAYARFGLSWGDKEYFWLACALANASYAFSEHAAAVVSLPDDMALHNETLCGSLAHYLPEASATPPLLYINGQYILTPPRHQGNHNQTSNNTVWSSASSWAAKTEALIAAIPEYVTPRHAERTFEPHRGGLNDACLIGQGATRIDAVGYREILIRRIQNTMAAAQELDGST
ncbi:hypothetical protein SDRG_02255 [Saprolegnia diclina VS20]|uniref:Nucleotide-diphospho-sugar transferase n=1 Tax=Saprolegnia diclina (strain VS20) TaxID=1156394 RepID=T0QQE2_SAPDV|nr:hypothetical protein SDRG_02255 [Saprolegnia diclina VS20]EQC40354.1 hypothetical protein SDRG_02255 [Saprolegnia diclina VS20]|eukprot:XP_008606053.1 hypothetical protein SDRG_02255 [Saprolegnia diclina VS20]